MDDMSSTVDFLVRKLSRYVTMLQNMIWLVRESLCPVSSMSTKSHLFGYLDIGFLSMTPSTKAGPRVSDLFYPLRPSLDSMLFRRNFDCFG